MDARNLLRVNYEKLLIQYNSNIQSVLTLQATLIRDILPSVADELELCPEALEWAKEWLKDTNSLFRMCKRNNFTRSFAMESTRKNLVWRLNNLWPSNRLSPIPMLHCLPESAHDPFDRPILIIEAPRLNITVDAAKMVILQKFEHLRLHLQYLNNNSRLGMDSPSKPPILQYVVILDLSEFSIRSSDKEFITWTLNEVIPRFPGMIAGVFMLNYSWLHSGMWVIIKRVLPASALSRIFFSSANDLIQYFTPSSLPKDYGGNLPCLGHINDPLQVLEVSSASMDTSQGSPKPSSTSWPRISPLTPLSPTSLLNPFFGYPVSSSGGFLSFYHGRRRKRDLARTLALLFWIRWRTSIITGLLLILCGIAVKLNKGRFHSHLLKSLLAQKLNLSFIIGLK